MENYNFVLGLIPPVMFLAMLLFAGLGVFIRLLVDSTKRDQISPNTPQKFSFGFLFKDNWKTILLSFILIMLTLRFLPHFFPDYFTIEELSSVIGQDKYLFGSVLVGYLYNSLSQLLKDKSDLLKTRNP